MRAKPARNSRQVILDRLRCRVVDQVQQPNLTGDGSIGDAAITFPDPVEQFAISVEGVGGQCLRVANLQQAYDQLAGEAIYRDADRKCSLVEGPFEDNVNLDDVADPHQLADVGFVIAPAEFAVAENGAMWITDAAIRQRVSLFITQHLALVVSSEDILHNMHQAYERIGTLEAGFGVFIAGPSKTADIEQSLVLGAHGCRSLTVLVVDPSRD